MTKESESVAVWDNSKCKGSEYCQPWCPRFFDGEGEPHLCRRYQSSDWNALISMYNEINASNGLFGLPPPTNEKAREWLSNLTSSGWNILAFHYNHLIVHVGAAPACSDEPHVVVFVHSGYQNRGIRTELMKQLIAYAENKDQESTKLSVAAGNERIISISINLDFDISKPLPAEYSMKLFLNSPVGDQVQRPPAERN